ncbi:hypothetical protein [Flavobacterium sp.]|uniref:hypothetical protein n=1 Tax=Flavobacterium sp. TaxID=239 RepID=UPI0035ADA61A
MKYLAFFMFFYFSALTVLPAVKVVKMHLAENCESSCHKNKSSEPNEGGCQKEKCLLNFSINSYTYVLFSNIYEFKNETIFIHKKEKIEYHKNFIEHYNVAIWQPPESFLSV